MIVDVVLCSGKNLTTINASKYTTLQVLKRTNEIQDYEDTMKIVNNAPHDFPDITVRAVVYPSQVIPDTDVPYNFDADQLKAMITMGIQDAIKAVKGLTIQ